jgi:hypothetical protein
MVRNQGVHAGVLDIEARLPPDVVGRTVEATGAERVVEPDIDVVIAALHADAGLAVERTQPPLNV